MPCDENLWCDSILDSSLSGVALYFGCYSSERSTVLFGVVIVLMLYLSTYTNPYGPGKHSASQASACSRPVVSYIQFP